MNQQIINQRHTVNSWATCPAEANALKADGTSKLSAGDPEAALDRGPLRCIGRSALYQGFMAFHD